MSTNTTTATKTSWIKLSSDSLKLLLVTLAGMLAWYCCKPQALTEEAWKLLVIFVGTIVAIILKPLPMGAIALTSVAVLCATKTLSLQTTLQGFAFDQIWLIVLA